MDAAAAVGQTAVMKSKRVEQNRAEAAEHRRRLQNLLNEKPYLPRADRAALAYAVALLEDLLSAHDEGSLH